MLTGLAYNKYDLLELEPDPLRMNSFIAFFFSGYDMIWLFYTILRLKQQDLTIAALGTEIVEREAAYILKFQQNLKSFLITALFWHGGAGCEALQIKGRFKHLQLEEIDVHLGWRLVYFV